MTKIKANVINWHKRNLRNAKESDVEITFASNHTDGPYCQMRIEAQDEKLLLITMSPEEWQKLTQQAIYHNKALQVSETRRDASR